MEEYYNLSDDIICTVCRPNNCKVTALKNAGIALHAVTYLSNRSATLFEKSVSSRLTFPPDAILFLH